MQLKVNGSVHCTRIPLGLNICLRSEFIELGYTQFKSVFIPTRLICLKCQIQFDYTHPGKIQVASHLY